MQCHVLIVGNYVSISFIYLCIFVFAISKRHPCNSYLQSIWFWQKKNVSELISTKQTIEGCYILIMTWHFASHVCIRKVFFCGIEIECKKFNDACVWDDLWLRWQPNSKHKSINLMIYCGFSLILIILIIVYIYW